MGIYTVTFDILGIFSGGVPQLTSLYGDVELSIDYAYSNSTSVSFEINTDVTPFYSTLLRFYFDDNANGTSGDSIQVNNLRIDGVDVGSGSQNVDYGGAFDIDVVSYIPDTQFGAPGTNPSTQAVITGTAGNDYLEGTAGADTIDGLAGNDRINTSSGGGTVNGGDGDDRIIGGSGDDNLNGDANNDIIWGGAGNDTINGGTGNDALYGMSGTNTINGGAGNDRIDGGTGNDTLNGDADADRIYGGLGDDTINGGTGNDRLAGNDGIDTIHGNENDDDIRGGNGNDILFGDDGNDNIDGQNDDDTINGGNGDDTISGDRGNDTIFGDANNDYINGGQGADTLNGGTGNDIIYGGGMQSYDQYNIRAASSFGATGVWFNEQTQSFYRFVDSNVNIATARANANSAILNGVAGHLVNITSQTEADYVDLLSGTRNIWLGGSDEITEGHWVWDEGVEAGAYFYDQSTQTSIGANYENWGGGEPNDYNTGEDYIQFRNGGTWNDYGPPYGTQSLRYVIEWEADSVMADNSADTLNGDAGNDQLYGGAGNDILNGGADDDILYGQEGNDTLNGDTGNDTIYGQTGNDTIDGGAGTDSAIYSSNWSDYTISLSGAVYTLIDNVGTDGTDTATLVENFHFADGSLTAANLLNVAPTITSDGGGSVASVTVVENTTAVTTVVATDPNALGPALVYSISGGQDASFFSIDSATGVLTFNSAPDYENMRDSGASNDYDVEVTVSDGQLEDVQSINVAITDVAEGDVGNTAGTAGSINVGEYVMYDVQTGYDRDWFGVTLTGGTQYVIRTRGLDSDAPNTTSIDPYIYDILDSSSVSVSGGNDDGGIGRDSVLYFTPGSTGTYYIDVGDWSSRTGTNILTVQLAGGSQVTGSGSQTLTGTAGADYLESGNQNDTLYGLGGNDILWGENGDDILDGGAGFDILYGQSGIDTFVFSNIDESDLIIDFSGDILDISSVITGFVGGTSDIDDYMHFQVVDGDTIVRLDTDGLANGTNFTEIAVIEGVTSLVVQTLYDNGDIIV